MSAFLQSGRSYDQYSSEIRVRFRPLAVVQLGKYSALLGRTVRNYWAIDIEQVPIVIDRARRNQFRRIAKISSHRL